MLTISQPISIANAELVLCGRKVVRVGDGEEEALRMCVVAFKGSPPGDWSIATKEVSFVREDEGNCGSFVVADFVEVCFAKPISR
jgi:hypothetical protein